MKKNRFGRESWWTRFVVPSDSERIPEMAGVQLPPYGVFLRPDGAIIPVVLRDTPFGRFRRGLFFSKKEAAKAVRSPEVKAVTSHDERRALYWEIMASGLARRGHWLLKQSVTDFERPAWGWCGTGQHLHLYKRGHVLVPAKWPERAIIRSMTGGVLVAVSLFAEGKTAHGDVARLIDILAYNKAFEALPIEDPPDMLGLFIALLR